MPYYSRKTTNQQCIERMQLQVIAYPDGKEKIKQFNINIDSIHWNAILGMENFRRNQELLDIAQEAFKGIDLDLGE